MICVTLLLFSFIVRPVFADNDWSKPCFSGVCQYDLPASNGSASGTLKIWGSDTAISDITTAAGWEIIDCSPDALQQDIRLVCKDGSSADCAHLYSGSANDSNAVGKLVRLPENCGKSAFAVVTKAWTPQDQSIPSNISSSLSRRDGTKPTVKGLHLDTSFASVNPSSAGPVNFAIRAANVPGANGDLATSPQQQRRSNSRIFRRGISGFVSGAINDISSLNDFNVNNSATLAPLDVDKPFNLVDKSVSCPPVDASVKVDVDAKAHAIASIGVAASGTIIPPKVTDFAIIAGLNADIDGSVDMKATASGTLDSGKIKLFEVGIPGLDFPGILTIGPSFQINGQATATLDVDVGLTVGITYSIENAQLTFPPKTASKGSFNIGDTPLKLSASPSVTATGTIEAHLIPSLNFGISALDNAVSANIFLDLDASATMTLTGQAQADASATINTQKRDLTKQANRGCPFWNPSSLNSRAPQSDGSQEDSSDDLGGDDDSVDASDNNEDGSQDDSGSGVGTDGDSDTSGNDAEGSQDDSTGDSGDGSSTADDGTDDTSTDDDEGDSDVSSGDDSSLTIDDGTSNNADGDSSDGTGSDFSGDSNDGGDNSAVADNSDVSDSGSADTSDDGADATANDGTDTSDEADPSDDVADDNVPAVADDASASDDSGSAGDTSSTSVHSAASDSGNTNSTAADSTADNTDSDNTSSASNTATPSATSSADTVDSSPSPNEDSVASTDNSSSFGGCFSVDAGLDVNAGADGSFFGLFDANTKVELFSKKFELFKKCFGSNSARRSIPKLVSHKSHFRSRFLMAPRPTPSLLRQRGFSLTCPNTEDGANKNLENIADETIAAADISQE